jgi:hypothetical protein
MHTTQAYTGGVEVSLQSFLTMTPDTGEWSASCPGHFASGKNTKYQVNRGLGGPHSQSGYSEEEINQI